MALAVRTFTVDPHKEELRRDHFDSTHAPARFDIRIVTAAVLTGVTITLQSPVPGAAPIVLTAGTDFLATAVTRFELAQSVLAAIDRAAAGLLSLTDPVDPDFLPAGGTGEPGAAVYAPRPGAWGEAITLSINIHANAANIEVNGTVSAAGYTENAVGGSGPKGTSLLEAFLETLTPPTQPSNPPDLVSVSQSTLASGEVHYTVLFDTA